MSRNPTGRKRQKRISSRGIHMSKGPATWQWKREKGLYWWVVVRRMGREHESWMGPYCEGQGVCT